MHKAFGDKQVLAGVSLKVMPGESLVIIGGSGTGKSVTLKCILGILRARRRRDPDRRRARRAHRPPRVPAPFRHAVPGRRAVRQPDGLAERRLPPAPGAQAAAARGGARARHRQARAASASGRRPPTSTRRSCRAACRSASAWRAPSPPTRSVIFFDEPTSGLDPIMAGVINDLIRELVDRDGRDRGHHHPRHDARRAPSPTTWRCCTTAWCAGRARSTTMEASGDPYLDQFIHGRATGPIAAVR